MTSFGLAVQLSLLNRLFKNWHIPILKRVYLYYSAIGEKVCAGTAVLTHVLLSSFVRE